MTALLSSFVSTRNHRFCGSYYHNSRRDRRRSKAPYQNMVEAAFLQTIVTQACEQGEYVILLGDFNTAEEHNHTERMWDPSIPLISNTEEDEPDELALFGAIKDKFIENYYRGIPASLPTNVYPFLAGGSSVPKHNDDIWLPKGR